MKGRTTFVIAHRLATIRNATRILVFKSGRIVESGSYDELIKLGGMFAELAAAQFGLPSPLAGEGAERAIGERGG
jgi:ATP-binding cassette, subfamily B, beta-glucan exporter